MKVLTKEHGILSTVQDSPGGGVFTFQSFTNGWRIVNPAGSFVSSTYFDLAGMSLREKTLFFEGATVQELVNPQHTAGQPGDSMVVVDLMTTIPLSDEDVINFALYGNFAGSPSQITFQQTTYARVNQYVVDIDTQAWGSYMLVASNQLGSLDPSASDRIYSYRGVLLGTPTQATKVELLSARHLLQSDAKTEEEFQYLMRLKRSYELQQSHDED